MQMCDKPTIMIYKETASRLFDRLTDGDAGKLIKTMLHYDDTGAGPSVEDADKPDALDIAFVVMKDMLDRDAENYREKKRKKQEAGKAGGLAKASNARQTLAEPSSASSAKQCLAEPSSAKQCQADASTDKQTLANLALTLTPTPTLTQTLTQTQTEEIPPNPPLKGGRQTDKPSAGRKRRSVFVKPTVEEVRAYCEERQNGIDPEEFMDYYNANGWMVDRSRQMRDWRATVNKWERNRKKWAKEREEAEKHSGKTQSGQKWQQPVPHSHIEPDYSPRDPKVCPF